LLAAAREIPGLKLRCLFRHVPSPRHNYSTRQLRCLLPNCNRSARSKSLIALGYHALRHARASGLEGGQAQKNCSRPQAFAGLMRQRK
jgi:hypothetical protein